MIVLFRVAAVMVLAIVVVTAQILIQHAGHSHASAQSAVLTHFTYPVSDKLSRVKHRLVRYAAAR